MRHTIHPGMPLAADASAHFHCCEFELWLAINGVDDVEECK
jgi:hypothetical protein